LSSQPRIDLYSDTQTRPTAAMREAMARAEVADEQRGEDPTTNRLTAMVCDLLGVEAAVLLPSGTMCNQIAALVHLRPGEEIVCHRSAHIHGSEGGGAAAFAGASFTPIDSPRGIFDADALAAAIRPKNRYAPRSRMLVVEQTANLPGGSVWLMATIEAVSSLAAERGLVRHMDGARLLNAVVASGVSARDQARHFDSVWIDLSKGLGCPIGGVLGGSEAFIAEAWQWKQRMGGAMRQSGIVAAAGIHALGHHIDRLAEDHANARLLGERLADVPGLIVEEPIDTNMVFLDTAGTALDAPTLVARLEAQGIRMGAMGPTRIRAVTHLDVTREMVEEAAATLRTILGEAAASA